MSSVLSWPPIDWTGSSGRAPSYATRSDGAAVISVSSTATGGGVAEMLQVLLPYARGAGIEARWLVIEGDERFFTYHQAVAQPPVRDGRRWRTAG